MEQVIRYSETLIEALEITLQKKLTFAIYRLPGNQDITFILQKNNNLVEVNDFSEIPPEGGFLISPFNAGPLEKSYLIRPDFVFKKDLSLSNLNEIKSIPDMSRNGSAHLGPLETKKEDYLRQIEQTIDKIKNGEYEKVVLSRVKSINGAFSRHLNKIFQLLSESYPYSFVYLMHFKHHCWVGASPEPLIFSEKDKLITVSLAGTRPYSEKNMDILQWNHKERIEQEYVTRYIERILNEYGVKTYRKIGPYTKKAARLLHLRTDFIFNVQSVGGKLPALIKALHPTSAVCGMPKERSMEFIKQIEKHNREYYAGYLGPVGIDEGLQLFVNLRCMKVLENQLALYVGGGITVESVPEEEWEETEIKADTLLSILKQIH
jgi:isochorismate synthase